MDRGLLMWLFLGQCELSHLVGLKSWSLNDLHPVAWTLADSGKKSWAYTPLLIGPRNTSILQGTCLNSMLTTITKSHRLGGYKQQKFRNLFLKVLEVRSPQSRCQQGWVLVRSPSWVAEFSLYPHVEEGARESRGSLFHQAVMSFMRALLLWFKHFPNALPPNTITLEIRISPVHLVKIETEQGRPSLL